MLLEKELCDFSSEMYLDLIMKFNNDIEFEETNKFTEKVDLRTLDVNQLMNSLEKSLSVSIDKVEKMLNKNLEASDLIRLCHIGIEIANSKFESSRKRRSAESDGSPPNKKTLIEITNPNPIQHAIPLELERRVIEMEYSSHTGPPGDLDVNKKRWLVVGIGLHSILSPALRKYVEPVLNNFYKALKLSDQIDKQSHPRYLRTNGVRNVYLNYEPINMNKTTHGYRQHLYDYKVQNAVDLSKLFLQTYMAHYTAFDGSCDSSALLGMIDKIDQFPGNIRTVANDVKSNVRNDWAHCNFTVWDDVKYVQSLKLIEDLIYLLRLNAPDEKQMIDELDKWRKNGTSFLQGYTISDELANEIRQQIQILKKYAEVIYKTADTEFEKVNVALIDIGETLRQYGKRISTLENTVAIQGKTLMEYGSSYDADIPEIQRWKQNSKDFIKTDIFTEILGIIKSNHCVLLTGVSGMGKTLTAQNIALQLCQEEGYSIVPCNTVKDIKKRYKDNVRQVFFVDDICGKYTANIKYIENWMRIKEFVTFILRKGQTKILATCRTEIVKQKNVEKTLKSFLKMFDLTRNYSAEDKMKLARKYLKVDDEILTDIIKKVEFSPLMCFLYSKLDGFDLNEFLNSPCKTFTDEWDILKTFDKEKFCVLLLCVIYNGTINESMFDVLYDFDKEEKRKLKVIFECCNLGRDTPRSAIKDKLNACVGTYFTKVDEEYKIIHDKMFDFLCDYFGKSLVAPILKYADDKLICERVQLESIQKPHGESTIIVSTTDEQKYKARLKMDLKNGKIHWCLNNAQMRYKEYRDKFLDVVKDLDGDMKRRFIDTKDENGINSFIVSCLRGYDDLVLFFISVGADVNARNGWFNPLTAACRDGHSETVDILLDKGAMVNKTNKFGETPLYTACTCGHYGIVKRLIEQRCDVNVRDKCNLTPLCISCLGGFKNIAILLIDQGINAVECCNSLLNATNGGHDDIVEMLVQKGWNVNNVDMQGKTALFIACEEGFLKIVLLLIDKNADIFRVNDSGKTPLHAACLAGNIEIVRTLIEHNGYIDMLDKDRESPLHKACRQGSTGVIQTLVDHGANINLVNTHGLTPLDLAKQNHDTKDLVMFTTREDVQTGSSKVTNTWCQNNSFRAQINDNKSYLVRYGLTPLYEACMDGDMKIVQSLITKGANVNMKTNCGEPPLVAACQQGHGFLIQLLIDKGADISDALLVAVQNDYYTTVKILSYKGGNLSYQTDDGKSLLKLAFEHGSIKVIAFLLQKGADITEVCNYYHLPLCIACTKGYDETVKLLIKLGVNCNDRCNKDGKTPLWSACQRGFNKIVDILIKNGSDVYEMNETGQTLLHVAHNFYIFQLLIDISLDSSKPVYNETNRCLDSNKPDSIGRYPLYESMVNGNDDISDYLIQNQCPIAISERDQKTALISVFESGNNKLSRLVVSKGYTNDIRSQTIVNHLCRLGNFEINRFLSQNIHGMCDIYRDNYTSVILADIAGNDDLAGFLQTHHCDNNNSSYSLSYCNRYEIVNLTKRRYHTRITTKHICKDYEYLFQACMTGQTQSWRMCIDGQPFAQRKINIFFGSKEPNRDIWFKQTPLCLASRKGHIEVVKLLLKYGAEVDKVSEDVINERVFSMTHINGYTPLFAACQRKYYKIADILLEKGANVNIALYDACRVGFLETVQFLAQKGADVNSICPNGQTALYAACYGGYYTIVKFLINQGALIDTRLINKANTLNTLTCLHVVYACGNLKILKLLIEQGSSITAIGILRRKLLHTACRGGKYKIVKAIIDYRIYINASDKFGTTPLLACVLQRLSLDCLDQNMITYFLKKRKRLHFIHNEPILKQDSIINKMMNDKSYDELIFHDIDDELIFEDIDDELIFDDDIKRENRKINHCKVIQLLLENGADINIADSEGRSPLSVARESGNRGLIEILQKKHF